MTQDYGFRLYNPAIAKFLSVDPLSDKYPWYTPYQFAGNMPICATDLDGLEPNIVIRYWDGSAVVQSPYMTRGGFSELPYSHPEVAGALAQIRALKLPVVKLLDNVDIVGGTLTLWHNVNGKVRYAEYTGYTDKSTYKAKAAAAVESITDYETVSKVPVVRFAIGISQGITGSDGAGNEASRIDGFINMTYGIVETGSIVYGGSGLKSVLGKFISSAAAQLSNGSDGLGSIDIVDLGSDMFLTGGFGLVVPALADWNPFKSGDSDLKTLFSGKSFIDVAIGVGVGAYSDKFGEKMQKFSRTNVEGKKFKTNTVIDYLTGFGGNATEDIIKDKVNDDGGN